MPLARIGSLLPYHSHVDPETVTSALNHMIDEAAGGKTVFYSFYSESQRLRQPAKSNTGLFYFRGRPGAPFAVISPGGGFSYVASVHEGFPYAAMISRKGYNAFVLRYRAGYGAKPLLSIPGAVRVFHSAQPIPDEQRSLKIAPDRRMPGRSASIPGRLNLQVTPTPEQLNPSSSSPAAP